MTPFEIKARLARIRQAMAVLRARLENSLIVKAVPLNEARAIERDLNALENELILDEAKEAGK